MDVNRNLIHAVRFGRLEEARKLINSFGLSYSPAWSEGYVLLCEAVKNRKAAVAKLLLTSGCKVNSKTSCIKPSDTPLHFAVREGDIEIIKMILDKGANINAKNDGGEIPLYDAIKYDKIEIVKLLLKHGANVNDSNKHGQSLLYVAVLRGNLKIVEHLLKFGANVNCVYTGIIGRIYAPLHCAVDLGLKEIATLLLSRGAHVDSKGEDGITCLQVAAKKGYAKIAEDLVNHGACIHSSSLKEEYTPLHFTSERGNEEAVKLLLDRGADSNARTKDNLTPLHLATKSGCRTVVRLLLQHGANVDNQDKDGKTILHLAVENGNLVMVEDVLKYCPDINNQSNNSSLKIAVLGFEERYKKIVESLLEYGLTANPEDVDDPKLFLTAVEKGYLKIVRDLLKYGANVNALYHLQGRTPLHSAAKNKRKEVAELLISYEADTNALDKNGKTPIFYAIEKADLKITKLLLSSGADIKNNPELLNMAVDKKQIEIVEALLQYDADVNAFDKYGKTALHSAAKNKQEEVAELLISYKADTNALDKNGKSPIFYAIENADLKITKLLLSSGADIKCCDEYGRTALHVTAGSTKRKDYFRYQTYEDPTNKGKVATLLSKGANVNAKQKNGMTALHTAIQMCHKNVVKILLECGAKVENGALHLAAKRGCCEIIKTIMKCGTDINSKDDCGRTALHIASQEGHTEAVSTLLNYGADINITCENNRTPLGYVILDHYSSRHSYNETTEVLELHIVKMRTANLHVKDSTQYMSEYFKFRRMEDDCKEEIEIMKSEKIKNTNVSFYNILANGINSTAMYLRNENILLTLKAGDYKTKFPLYAGLIELNFNKGLKRKELLEQGNEVSHFLFNNLLELPQDCTEKIFSYLNDKDLRILIEACKAI